MNRLRLAVAGCAMLLTAALATGCTAAPSAGAAPQIQPLTSSSSKAATSSAPATKVLGDGLTVSVSAPRSFTPTDAAYPRSPRAVAFEMVITNNGGDVYHPADLSVTAICNAAAALQLIDSTQGYTGLVGSSRDIPPGEDVHLTVAFAVPAQRAEFRLMAAPDPTADGLVTLFEGAV